MPTLTIDPERLRTARLTRALTCERLAAAAGLHRQTIDRLESGERNANLETIYKLASALDVEPLAISHIAGGE